MSLYGNTDTAGNKPKWLTTGEKTTTVFLDVAEAQNPSNRAKGLKTPGWNTLREWVDNAGNQRYSAEPLAFVRATAAAAGDAADDVIAGDVAFAVTTSPVNASVTGPAAVTFTVVSAGAAGFQWQRRLASGGQYVDIVADTVFTLVTTAVLTITASTGLSGQRYRCVVLNGTSNAYATSAAATLTVL